MVTTLIITRAVHIAASILIAGIFTFDLIMLGLTGPSESDDLHEIEAALIPPGCLESDCGASFRCALVLARSREHEWIAAQEYFLGVSVGDGFA